MRTFNKDRVPKPRIRLPKIPKKPLDVEIGCGVGLHTVNYALHHTDRIMVGVDRSEVRMKKMLDRMAEHGNPTNLIPIRENAIWFLSHEIEDNRVENYFFLYPNPYPKKKQANMRWYQMPFMAHVLATLKKKGKIHFATNMKYYAEGAIEYMTKIWKMKLIKKEEYSSLDEIPFEPRTHFEKKYLARGETCWNLVFEKSSRAGFTLLELMVVVLIVGVLAAVGVPSYKEYVIRSKKSEAYKNIAEISKREVVFYSENQRFKPFEANGGGIESNYLIFTADNLRDLGYPFGLVGDHTHFQYSAFAGKFLADGSEVDGVENPGTGHEYNTVSQNIGSRDFNGMGAQSPSGACWVGPLENATFGQFVNQSPGAAYDWVVIIAKQDTAQPDNPQSCDFVFKVLEAYPNTTQSNAHGIGGWIELKSGPAFL